MLKKFFANLVSFRWRHEQSRKQAEQAGRVIDEQARQLERERMFMQFYDTQKSKKNPPEIRDDVGREKTDKVA
ncbi:MAG: hypothetical protein UY20_C0006G0012 [Candidatus Yanofskybacteria bacterium GW2011_GWA1_48_10]|uniref:Uncharacterized protein n=2 Tax=Candidatus Yanofskyibacteriota TaxID=1752733 RepID=A0A0G1U6P0_9BACT|nr:MAG: hypothetical protein UY20_C0006G0012 [Candidatus Yanofskybacteria bacterium GW2011_GWA1_48_10]OGN06142.1 MAG: hypothetical protein A2669_02755 [Candidatus Yanofskybacteria bacterium RIFCSPHIGHO2_01_FULL_48_25b]